MNRLFLSAFLLTALSACGGNPENPQDMDSQATASPAQAQPDRAGPAVADRAGPARADGVDPATPARAIEAGTVLTFEVREEVSTSSHASGDAFSLVLVDPVTGPGGAVLPAGTAARGLVTDAHASSGPEDQALLGVQLATIEAGGSQRPIAGQVQSADIKSSSRDSGARTAATIATGAAAGAIVGQILGRDTRSTVAGAAVGAAVGVGVALTTRGGDAVLPQGSRIVMRLDRDLVF